MSADERALKTYESELFHWDSPGMWAILAILILGVQYLIERRRESP